VNILWFLLIGLLAGWLANQVVKGGSAGIVVNMIIGCIGAILGGFLFRLVGMASVGLMAT
jgi:uncharacterized membrane protein YeaQ/YmgE (transglycosylase-associated protein family)